jgi:hypothetical protein
MKDATSPRDETVARLLAARGEGVSIEAALTSLREALGPGYRESLTRMEALLAGRVAEADPAQAEVARLVALVRERRGEVLPAYVQYRHCTREVRELLQGFFGGLVDQGTYLMALVIVLTVILSTYSLFVYPAIFGIYSRFEGDMPGATAWLFGRAHMAWALVIVLTTSLVAGWWGAKHIRGRMRSLLPLGRMAHRLPLLRTLAARLDALRWLQGFAVLRAGGLAPEAAREAVTVHVGAYAGEAESLEALTAAERLGALDGEIEAQIALETERVMRALARTRLVVLYALRITVYAIIAFVVTSMYMPIFGMGSLV